MSKNIVRKANKTIIDRILSEMDYKLQIASHDRDKHDSINESFFLNLVYELKNTEFNLFVIGVFNSSEHEFFTREYVERVLRHGYSVSDVLANQYPKE